VSELLRTFISLLVTTVTAIVPVILLLLLPWWALLAVLFVFTLWIGLTRTGTRVWSVTKVGLASIPGRLGSSSVIVVGIAGVVGVLVALLAMAQGFDAALRGTGAADTAIITRVGSQTEVNSVLDRQSVDIVSQAPQVLRNAQGEPIASAELVVINSIPKKSNGLDANVELRGIGERGWELRPRAKIIAGRPFKPGLREMVVGSGAVEKFVGLDVDSVLTLNGQPWRVVGVFDTDDAQNSELWADASVVASVYSRDTSVASLTVRLLDPTVFAAFKAHLAADPRLKISLATTRDFYGRQSQTQTRLIRSVGLAIGIIMAIGAAFGALNTMYSAVVTRSREIATLRAVGFQGFVVVVSILIETAALALLGGVIGACASWLIFHGYTASTLGANFSQVVFAFDVSTELLLSGLKWAFALGIVGGLFPALYAARMPVTQGLRGL
jgi:putative ABC transport system permease protein